MAPKPINREVILASILDVILGAVLLIGTPYVVFQCLALAG
jgi:hypothetical protein